MNSIKGQINYLRSEDKVPLMAPIFRLRLQWTYRAQIQNTAPIFRLRLQWTYRAQIQNTHAFEPK